MVTRNTNSRMAFFLMVGLAVAMFSLRAAAETTTFHDDQIPTKKDIIKAFSDDGADVPESGVSLEGMGSQMGIVKRRPKRVSGRKEADFRSHINFEFGSAELTPKAERVLNELGGALDSEEMKAYRFVIEGHTDSVGSRRYNQNLSERRARAAKNYLVRNQGIDARRLTSVGRGEDSLLPDVDSESSQNRRVVVIKTK